MTSAKLRTLISVVVLTCSAGAARAQDAAPTAPPSESRANPDPRGGAPGSVGGGAGSLGARALVAPLENYPRWGLGLQGAYSLGADLRLGGEFAYYLSRQEGDLERSLLNLGARVEYSLWSQQRWRWYLVGGVALGWFRDDYVPRSTFSDQSVLAPGVLVATGLELRATQHVWAFLEPRATSYWTKRIADDEWLELAVGLRWGR